MRLHDLIVQHRAEIVARWTESIHTRLAPEGTTKVELVDHLPAFLDEVALNLAEHGDGTDPSLTAAQHGVQRLRLGFNLAALVREYGMLRDTLMTMVRETHLAVDPRDLDVLFDSLISGIADAVTQYTEEREAELRRQSNEHFAFVAHELRNPLSAAQLSLGNLQSKGALPESRSAEILKRSLGRMQQLIEQSLGMAFAGAGLALQRSHVKLGELIEEATMEASILAEEKGIHLELPASDATSLDLDRKLILSALNNLVRNAVKFTPAGGEVKVRLRTEADRVAIDVEDRCGGIPAKNLETLFSPFVQAGTDRSGFGLGLSIAKQAAAAHGGSIEVANFPEKGCVFTLTLPRHAI